MKILLLIIGFVCTVLGFIGIVIPVWPTTPFLIIASVCFLKSGQKAYNFLYNNQYFGPYLQHYYTKQGIYKVEKQRAYIFLWISMFVSMILSPSMIMKVVLLFILICVNIHIACIKTRLREKTS